MGEIRLAQYRRFAGVLVKAPSRKASEPLRAWQRMLSGRRLDLLDPSPLDIEIEDIAHGLARVARWNGQTEGSDPFSVAQHSLVVVAILERTTPALSAPDKLAALLHDAPEYVIGDMISPFKAVIGGDYKAVENRLLSAIYRRFGLPAAAPEGLFAAIKSADRIAAVHEATRLAGFSQAEAAKFFGRPPIPADGLDLDPWPTGTAEERFLTAFQNLAPADAPDDGDRPGA
jgi:5'-deoxynucleotidase YfbR-like HD superfamily hydrolase